MFEILKPRKFALVLPAAAMLMIFGCKEDDATAAPAPEPVDLSKTEDLFSQPVKPNPLATDPNAVLIRVNGEEITRGEIMQVMQQAMQQFGGQIPPQQLQQIQGQMFEKIKNDLINQKLLQAAVDKADVKIDDAEIEKTIEQIKTGIPAGQTLEAALQAQNLTMEGLKENIRKDMVFRKFLEEKTKDVTEATEAEAKEYYDSNPDAFKKPESAKASHILIGFDNSLTNETAIAESKVAKKAELEKIRADILAGTISFEDAAKKYSTGPSSQQGGDLGEFTKGRMVPEFDAAVFSQEVGEVGDIVETQYGYHIIKVTGHTQEGTVSFEEAKADLIKGLSGQKKQQAVNDFIKSLRDSATIEEIAQ